MKQHGLEPLRKGARVMQDVVRDLRHGTRLIFKSPGFTAVAAIALGIGVGANLAVFGFVNALLLRPLPTNAPDRLIRADGGSSVPMVERAVAYDDYVEFRERNQTLSGLSLFHPGGILPVRGAGRPSEPIHVMPVTGNYFETIGVRAAVGRIFTELDDRADAGAVVLSYVGWMRHFDGDPAIVGERILINGVPFAVVGVTPESFTGTAAPVVPQIYATWEAVAVRLPGSEARRGLLIGRLAARATLSSARADFARIAQQLRTERKKPVSVEVYPAIAILPPMQRAFSVFAALFMIIVGAVLWIACSNVAILQMVRAAARRREMAIRLALGATRIQLVRQLLVENLLLAGLAGAIGAALALAVTRWLTQIQLPVPMPLALTSTVDWRVTAFAVAVSIAAALLSSLAAALDARQSSASMVLRESDSGARTFTRKSLVVVQVALSTVLLVVAVAMMRSLMQPPEPGLKADGVVIATISLPRPQYAADQATEFFERLLARAESIPDVAVTSVAETIPVAINRPLASVDTTSDVDAASSTTDVPLPRVLVNRVSRAHFRTLSIPLIQGRDFREQDDARAIPVAIVNDTLARRLWRGQSAIGRRLRLDSEWVTVVGVAKDSKYESVIESPKPFIYRPLGQGRSGFFEGTLLVKASGNASSVMPLIRSLVADLDPNLVVTNLNTLEDRLALGQLPNRAIATTAGVLGVLALVLGAVGTYSVIAFLVVQRRREIGVRLALGALPSTVVRMVASQGASWIATGLVIGVAGGYGVVRMLQARIIGISVQDPLPAVMVLLLLGATGSLASYVPAREAGRGDPLALLRE